MDEYIEREKLLRDIERYHLSDGMFQRWVKVQLAADVAPVSELEKLRDTLYENDWILFNGLSELNKLIERYKRNNEVSE